MTEEEILGHAENISVIKMRKTGADKFWIGRDFGHGDRIVLGHAENTPVKKLSNNSGLDLGQGERI